MCTSRSSATTTLRTDGQARRHARTFLDDAWCTVHLHLLRPQAEAILDELVTDAVRHGAPPVRVAVECDGTAATIQVSDSDPDPGPLVDGSRGAPRVMLVDVLSDRWGVRTRPGGKTVWSHLVGT